MPKKCIRCGEEKPVSEFYKHPGMKDGHLNKCIPCAKRDAIVRRNAHIEEVREYDRKRSETPEYRKRQSAYIQKMKAEKPDEYKAMRAEVQRRYRAKYQEKTIAHMRVCDAIISGKLAPSKSCAQCGGGDKLQAHHEDYKKALEVIWLCDACHKKRHREINAKRRTK